VSERSFGRRSSPQAQRSPVQAQFQRKTAALDDPVVEASTQLIAPEIQAPSVDAELEAWKKSRKGFTIPWRQLSLMASLSFGIASLVLPASVNHNVDYVLYALAGMSLYAGISKRLKI
jgi:hypothetical protein